MLKVAQWRSQEPQIKMIHDSNASCALSKSNPSFTDFKDHFVFDVLHCTHPSPTMHSPAFLPCHPLQPTRRVVGASRERTIRAVLETPPAVSAPRRVWKSDSWQERQAHQQPTYTDAKALASMERQLLQKPPLVGLEECHALRAQLAEACAGRAFVLQGGDCAEDLAEPAEGVAGTLRALFRMAVVLMWGARAPVIKIGRLGGQYAKPRSKPTETLDGVTLPTYRGEIVNGAAFDAATREPDPDRMMRAYSQSAATTNYTRALSGGGYASLKNVLSWGIDWCSSTEKGREYMITAERIAEAIDFMDVCGLGTNSPITSSTNVYTSHEGLLLPYEQALIRQDPITGEYYAGSGHFIWIGERTRGLDDAHVEFMRGISNPIGVKAGPTMKPDELLRLCDVLNPLNEPGRLTVITRMGADSIEKNLPAMVRALKREGRHVVWVSDSMHGNTFTSDSGYKTRSFDAIMREVHGFFAVHAAEGSVASGLHFEMTGKKVTECIGGMGKLTSNDLHARYESLCDPRLNLDQSLQMAFEVADILRAQRIARGG